MPRSRFGIAGIAGAGIQKAAAPSAPIRGVELGSVRYNVKSDAELQLIIRQGNLTGGLRVHCPGDKSMPTVGTTAMPAVAHACEAARAVPVEIGKIASELSANH